MNRGSAAVQSVLLLPSYQNNNLGWCEAPPAVEHPRDIENPPGTPSGEAVEIRNRSVSGGAFIPPFGGSLTREREGRGRNFSFTVLRLFFWLQKKRGKLCPADESTEEKSVRGAGAPSPPSEEGGGCLYKGFEQADGGRDNARSLFAPRCRRALK